jgi:hypothetical protein
MADLDVKIAAHYNVDSNTVKVQLYVVSDCDSVYHASDVLPGSTVQLFNVYNMPETGLVEVPLEIISFDNTAANQDGYFAIFFINPAVNTNIEARAVINLTGPVVVNAVTVVLSEEGTFSNQPSTSVVGNATNPSWHTDKNKQRDEPYQDVAPHTPIDLGDDQTVIPDPTIVNAVWADIQFEQLSEVQSDAQLPGQLIYLGGGGRLLPKPGSLSFQAIDVPPWELGTSTFAEQGSVQLLPNNTYTALAGLSSGAGNAPTGYAMDSPGINIIKSSVQKLQGDGFTANAWSLQLNGASPVSISPFSAARMGVTDPIPFDATKPIALSLLAGMSKNTPDSNITSAKLTLHFYDFADRELPDLSVAINPDDLFNARPLKPFSISAQPSQYPASTEKFTWSLEISEVHQGDFVTLLTSVPSVTYTPFATSQVLTDEIRETDNLSFAPTVPFDMVEGAAVFSLAIGFQGTPEEDKWIFDTRAPGALDNGVSLKVNTDGTLELLIDNGVTTGSITTDDPVPWISGKVTEVVAEWNSTLLRISVDGVELPSAGTGAIDMTDITAPTVQLGSNAAFQGSLDSEFIRAVFLKRPR